MKRVATVLAMFVVYLAGLSGQQVSLEVPSEKEYWLAPAPASVDMMELVTEYDNPRYDWSESRRHLNIFQIYQSHTLDVPHPVTGGNTYNILAENDFFRILRTHLELDVAMEVAGVKEYSCDGSLYTLNHVARASVESVLQVRRAGGIVSRISTDNSMFGGRECSTGNKAPHIVGQMEAWYIHAVRMGLRDIGVPEEEVLALQFGSIESYPHFTIREHKEYVATVHTQLAILGEPGFSHYHLDIDIQRVLDNQKFARDVTELASFLGSANIRFGMIINGADSDSPVGYFSVANANLARYKRLGFDKLVDNVIVQSWALSSNGQRYLPPNLPETDGYTHTSFLWQVLNCYHRPGWDCSRFPQPR